MTLTDPNFFFSSKRDLYLRPETFDDSVAAEVSGYKLLNPRAGGTLLDVGGNIGAVSRWWMKNGGENVVAVEPEPENTQLLRKNLEEFGDRATVYEAAAVNRAAPKTLNLFLNNGINKGAHTIRETRGRGTIEVQTVPLFDLIERHNPHAVKIDIEGGEFQLIDEILSLPPQVTRFAIEYHLNPKGHREMGRDLDAALQDSSRGWAPVRGTALTSSAWYVMRVYHR
jgi:FkbM family methyltransferase